MLYDRAKGESTPLFVSQPSLLDYKFAHMEDVRIKARDGLEHWTLTPTLTLTLTRTPTLTPTLTPTPTLIPTLTLTPTLTPTPTLPLALPRRAMASSWSPTSPVRTRRSPPPSC